MLTNCDAFDQFPPFPLTILFRIAKHPVLTRVLAGQARARFIRHSPLGFGPLSTNLDADQTRAWIEPVRADRAIRHDLACFAKQVDPKDLAEVAGRLHHFDRPVSLVWGMADRFFKPELGHRLEDAFADATFEEIPGARAFVSLDVPDRVADAILATVGATDSAQPDARRPPGGKHGHFRFRQKQTLAPVLGFLPQRTSSQLPPTWRPSDRTTQLARAVIPSKVCSAW